MTALITALLFVVAIFFLTVQVYNNSGTDSATILSGVLSMFGGAFGAFGAYLVARHQINNERKNFEERSLKKARPTIICLEYLGEADLKNTRMHNNARLIETDFYKKIPDKSKFIRFFEIRHIGNRSHILSCEINVSMDTNMHSEADSKIYTYMGAVERDVEIFIPLPSVFDGENSYSYTLQVTVVFETMENEKIEYINDIKNGIEQYYLISNQKRKLIKKVNFERGQWIMPGRNLKYK